MVTKRQRSADTEPGDLERARNDAWLGMERTEKIPEIVARRILKQITQSGMVAGDRLPSEAEMLAQLGIGRASLREALRILETHGIIRIKPGPRGGPRVTDMSPSDFGQTVTVYLQRASAVYRELLEARLVIEPMMAGLAAQRLTPESAARIREVAEWGWAAIDASAEVWSAAIERFHSILAGASGNLVLDLYASSLISIERQHEGPIFTDPKDRERTLRTHDKIAEAILSRDADRSEALARRHIQAVSKAMEAIQGHRLAERIEWKA